MDSYDLVSTQGTLGEEEVNDTQVTIDFAIRILDLYTRQTVQKDPALKALLDPAAQSAIKTLNKSFSHCGDNS